MLIPRYLSCSKLHFSSYICIFIFNRLDKAMRVNHFKLLLLLTLSDKIKVYAHAGNSYACLSGIQLDCVLNVLLPYNSCVGDSSHKMHKIYWEVSGGDSSVGWRVGLVTWVGYLVIERLLNSRVRLLCVVASSGKRLIREFPRTSKWGFSVHFKLLKHNWYSRRWSLQKGLSYLVLTSNQSHQKTFFIG